MHLKKLILTITLTIFTILYLKAQVKQIFINVSQINIEDCLTGVNNSFSDCNFSISPNPSSGLVTLKINSISNEKNVELYVYDLLGHIIFKESIKITDTIEKTINLSDKRKGNYLLVIKGLQNDYYQTNFLIH